MAPAVDLWKLMKNKTFKNINYKKTLLFSLKVVLFLGFLYCWNHWAFITLLFSKDNTLSIQDYFVTLPFNIGLLAALLPFNRLIMVIAMLPIVFTSFIYTNTLMFASSKEDAWVGILMNLGAIFLFWYNRIVSKQKVNGVKT
jgi:hypothetical protein